MGTVIKPLGIEKERDNRQQRSNVAKSLFSLSQKKSKSLKRSRKKKGGGGLNE